MTASTAPPETLFVPPPGGPRRANARFVFTHPAHWIAFGFGVGLAPVAPGTFGTLLGWAIYAFLASRVPHWDAPLMILPILLVAFALGVWACDRTGRALGTSDPGGIVWDEMVAIGLVLAIAPQTFAWQCAAVVLFRTFDIAKPPPIDAFERRYRNGLGVMGDDLLAAFYTLLVLAALKAGLG